MTENAKRRKLTVRYYLRENGDNDPFIYQICRWTDWDGTKRKLVISTKHSVKKRDFISKGDKKSIHYQRVKSGAPNADKINRDLDTRKITAQRKFENCQEHSGKLPSVRQFKEILSPTPETESNQEALAPLKYFWKCAEQKDHPSTRTQYKQTVKILKKYSGSLDWKDITPSFLNEFETYLKRKSYKFNGEKRYYARNNIGKHMSRIKALMNQALKEEVPGVRFQNNWITVKRETMIKAVYLNENELGEMFRMKFKPNESRLEKARDLFLIGAWTGLRYSDYSRITLENIEDGMINMGQRKLGGEEVYIPIHPHVQEIIDRGIPEPISNQKLNDYLKVIAKKIPSLHETIVVSRFEGASEKQTSRTFQKWQLVSTHTARRSFATNFFLRDWPISEIMEMTGHATESAFKSYVKIEKKQRAQKNLERFRREFIDNNP